MEGTFLIKNKISLQISHPGAVFFSELFKEMSKQLKLTRSYVNDSKILKILQGYLKGLFPKDNIENLIFAIESYTELGLNALVNDLCKHLKSQNDIEFGLRDLSIGQKNDLND